MRQIKTPADAVPHEAYVEITPERGHPSTEHRKFFTAAECAQIARAYATAFHKEIRANETRCKGIGRRAAECRAKFTEWEKQT